MGSKGSTHSAGFALHSMRGRWFSIYAAFLIMSGCGTTYLFGTYSKEISTNLRYDQSELGRLAFYNYFGSNFAVLNGLIAQIAPSWLVLLLGGAMNFGGYFMIWLAVTERIAKPKFWQMCTYIFIAANAANFAGTPAIVTSVKNFPENRGVVLGLLKSYVGLSGAIITQLYLAFYGNNPKSLILFISWFPALLFFVFMFSFRRRKFMRQPQEIRVFYHFLYVSMVLAVFLMAITIAARNSNATFFPAVHVGCAMVVFVLLFILPLLISLREEHFDWTINNPYFQTPRTIQSKANPFPRNEHKGESFSLSYFSLNNIINKPERGEDHTILQAILSIDMMYLFITTACGLGAGLTAINNLQRIGEALGYPTETIESFASLVNIWNYVGRVFTGFVSEFLLRRYRVPRPAVLTFMLALSSVGYILVAFPFRGSIYVASVIIGFSFGSQLPLANAIISEVFGIKYYSTLFNCGQSASPLGAYILNAKIVQPNYRRMAETLGGVDEDNSVVQDLICSGEICFKDSFTVLASVTALGAFVSQILMERTRTFYEGDIYKKFRENCAEEEEES